MPDVWTSAAFLADVTSWVESAASEAGLRLAGPVELPHVRAWSSAMRFPTDDGAVWCKVNGPGTRFEPPLLRLLSTRVPGLVPRVLAVEEARGWTLMADAGPVLRTVARPADQWDRWCSLLEEYAEAQLTLAPHADALRRIGVEWLPPSAAPARLVELVATLAATPVEAGGLTTEETARLEQVLPRYASWAVELDASGVPPSLNHDDLHSSNVSIGSTGMRVVDWGDAHVSHPFATMLVTLNSIAWHAGTTVDAPDVERVRDAYRGTFRSHGGTADLVRWVDLARRTGCLGRALAYVRALAGEPLSAHAELDWPVRGWLLELLDAPDD